MKKIITICLLIAVVFTTQAQTKKYTFKQSKVVFIFAPEIQPSFFSGGDVQLAFKLVKNIYVGGEYRVEELTVADHTESFGKNTYGGFLSYKVPLNKSFSIWANGGYYYTSTVEYKYFAPTGKYPPYNEISQPSTSELSVKWAIGVNWVTGSGFGITIFTPEAKALMIGVVIGH
jgi:hypothetical protein